jgi:hypothetical protein
MTQTSTSTRQVVLTRDDMNLFLRGKDPINPELAAASDERDIV